MTPLLLLVIVSSFLFGSASDECAGDNRSSVLVVPSSGPTVCLPIDVFIQLRQEAASVSDGKTVSYVQVLPRLCHLIVQLQGNASSSSVEV